MKKGFIIMLLLTSYGSFAQTKISFNPMDKNEINVSAKLGTGTIEQAGAKFTGMSKSVNVSFSQKLSNIFYLSAGLSHTVFEFNSIDNLVAYNFIQIPVQLKTDFMFIRESESFNNGYISAGLGLIPNYLYEVSNSATTGWNIGYISSIAFKYELSDILTTTIGLENTFDISKIDNLKMKNNNSVFLAFGYKF